MPSPDKSGPWEWSLDPVERIARLRALRALARVLGGPVATDLCEALRQAETDPAANATALAELKRLPSKVYQSVLASYGAMHCPNWQR
jgi:hypothetical protein